MRRELCAEAIRLARVLRGADARRARGGRAAGADAAARLATRGPHGTGGRGGAARRPGPVAVGPRADRGGHRARARPLPRRRPTRCRRRSRRCTPRGRRPRRPTGAQIAALYELLARWRPARWSSSTARSRWRWPRGPSAGLELIDAIEGLDGYHLMHAARADLLRRLGRDEEAGARVREGDRARGAAVRSASSWSAVWPSSALRWPHVHRHSDLQRPRRGHPPPDREAPPPAVGDLVPRRQHRAHRDLGDRGRRRVLADLPDPRLRLCLRLSGRRHVHPQRHHRGGHPEGDGRG